MVKYNIIRNASSVFNLFVFDIFALTEVCKNAKIKENIGTYFGRDFCSKFPFTWFPSLWGGIWLRMNLLWTLFFKNDFSKSVSCVYTPKCYSISHAFIGNSKWSQFSQHCKMVASNGRQQTILYTLYCTDNNPVCTGIPYCNKWIGPLIVKNDLDWQ